jgi:hypothetical protein
MPYCFSTKQPPRTSGTASLARLDLYQRSLTRGGHSSSIVTRKNAPSYLRIREEQLGSASRSEGVG